MSTIDFFCEKRRKRRKERRKEGRGGGPKCWGYYVTIDRKARFFMFFFVHGLICLGRGTNQIHSRRVQVPPKIFFSGVTSPKHS